MMISEKNSGHSIHQKPPYRAKSMLTVAEAAKVAQRHKVPLIVDAAAEEDLFQIHRSEALIW
ncbi:hypothetical protein JG559_08625 [Enterococcus faecalis]|uniref:Uncharacterized protein n=1 Tax=Enterococcus faecalis TaxID=1351 RepID=A0A974NZ98_ENTFL|nr:hypothetical protein JG559_08625 [Enterococcus faecalis]